MGVYAILVLAAIMIFVYLNLLYPLMVQFNFNKQFSIFCIVMVSVFCFAASESYITFFAQLGKDVGWINYIFMFLYFIFIIVLFFINKRNILLCNKNRVFNIPITDGLVISLDASDISSLSQTSNGDKPLATENQPVGLWRDKSGNNNHFLQPQQEACPYLVKKGIGNKPSIKFNTEQSISTTTHFPAPVTVIYVARQTGGSNKRVLSAMVNNWLLGYWNGNKNQAFYDGWVSEEGGTPTDDLPHVFSGIIRGSGQDSEFWADGEKIAINNNGIAGPDGLAINTGKFSEETSDCQVAEIIVFKRVISPSERQTVETYLKTKWNIN